MQVFMYEKEHLCVYVGKGLPPCLARVCVSKEDEYCLLQVSNFTSVLVLSS